MLEIEPSAVQVSKAAVLEVVFGGLAPRKELLYKPHTALLHLTGQGQ